MKRHTFAMLALAFLAAQAVQADGLTGKVVGVHDGDTITILSAGNTQHKIRLGQIDAPELRQDFGQVSKDALAAWVFGKTVDIEVETTDRYGRTVGRVRVDGQDANLAQVQAGMAWVYRQYAKDPAYFAAEDAAKAAKRGVWSRPDAVPPWEYRHGGQASDRTPAASAASAGCGGKRYCKDMANCGEAQHYLKDCGLDRLDRDGDGVPCESICGKR